MSGASRCFFFCTKKTAAGQLSHSQNWGNWRGVWDPSHKWVQPPLQFFTCWVHHFSTISTSPPRRLESTPSSARTAPSKPPSWPSRGAQLFQPGIETGVDPKVRLHGRPWFQYKVLFSTKWEKLPMVKFGADRNIDQPSTSLKRLFLPRPVDPLPVDPLTLGVTNPTPNHHVLMALGLFGTILLHAHAKAPCFFNPGDTRSYL